MYWQEVLKFQASSACVDCCKCRWERHEKERLAQTYGELLGKADKNAEEWDRLSAVADRLFEIGYIRKPETLAKTRMPKRLRR